MNEPTRFLLKGLVDGDLKQRSRRLQTPNNNERQNRVNTLFLLQQYVQNNHALTKRPYKQKRNKNLIFSSLQNSYVSYLYNYCRQIEYIAHREIDHGTTIRPCDVTFYCGFVKIAKVDLFVLLQILCYVIVVMV